jgi:hypothetical protein
MALGDPCSDWDKLASDPSTGEEIVCGANTSPATQLFWTKAPELTGASRRPYPNSRLSPDQHRQRQFPSDKVYRSDDRGLVGVEALSPQCTSRYVIHTVLDVGPGLNGK